MVAQNVVTNKVKITIFIRNSIRAAFFGIKSAFKYDFFKQSLGSFCKITNFKRTIQRVLTTAKYSMKLIFRQLDLLATVLISISSLLKIHKLNKTNREGQLHRKHCNCIWIDVTAYEGKPTLVNSSGGIEKLLLNWNTVLDCLLCPLPVRQRYWIRAVPKQSVVSSGPPSERKDISWLVNF